MTEDLDKDRYRHSWEEDRTTRPARSRVWIILGLIGVLTVTCVVVASLILFGELNEGEESDSEVAFGPQSRTQESGPSGTDGGQTPGDEIGGDNLDDKGDAASSNAVEAGEDGSANAQSIPGRGAMPGRIAVIDHDNQLLTVNPDGSEERLLSSPNRSFQFPAWSPKDGRLAVIGTDFDNSGVYVVTDGDGEQLKSLFEDQDQSPIYLFWSPDGQDVSFIARHPEGLALHLAPAQSDGPDQILTISPSSLFWNWLPDGRQVLVHKGFTARPGEISEAVFVPVEAAGDLEMKIHEEGSGPYQMPAVAKDGRFYALSDFDPDGDSYLKVFQMDSLRPDRAVPHQGSVAMGWSPTGAPLLAFTSPQRPSRSFYGPLRLLDVETGAIDSLATDVIVAFFWSPDGRSIAYLTLSDIVRPGEEEFGRTEVMLPTGPESRPDRVAKAARQERPRIILDLWVIDIEGGDPHFLTTFQPSDTFLSQFMPFFDQYAQSHRLWSPDSRSLVLPMKNSEELSEIVVVPANGDPPVILTPGVVAFWSQQ